MNCVNIIASARGIHAETAGEIIIPLPHLDIVTKMHPLLLHLEQGAVKTRIRLNADIAVRPIPMSMGY